MVIPSTGTMPKKQTINRVMVIPSTGTMPKKQTINHGTVGLFNKHSSWISPLSNTDGKYQAHSLSPSSFQSIPSDPIIHHHPAMAPLPPTLIVCSSPPLVLGPYSSPLAPTPVLPRISRFDFRSISW